MYLIATFRSPTAIWSRDVDDERVTKIPNKELRAKMTNKKSTSDQSDGGLVVIPYVGGLSEATKRTFRKYGISTAVKPYKTLRNLLVHPKDKRTIGQTGECVYKIPCHNCSSTYIGEAASRSYGKRSTEKKWNPSATKH